MADNYVQKVILSNYINSRIVEIENDDGISEKGLFIPLEINNLFVSSRNKVISWLFATEKMSSPTDGMTHYLKMKTNRDHVEKLAMLGYTPPYIGGMKRTYVKTNYQRRKEMIPTARVQIPSSNE